MERLWAPWRMTYISEKKAEECIFCAFPAEGDDERRLILYRGQTAFVIMNAFPYSNGHLMVVPYRHLSNIAELTDDESQEMMQLAARCCDVLTQLSGPEGFNVGMNLGRVAGAGIADHVHMHIVPRWNGDTNFMPVLADVKVVPEALVETYARLRPLFESRP